MTAKRRRRRLLTPEGMEYMQRNIRGYDALRKQEKKDNAAMNDALRKAVRGKRGVPEPKDDKK